MKTLRIDHVIVATPDAAGVQATFRHHFDLETAVPEAGGTTALTIGPARIECVTPVAGTAPAAALAANGEGMAALALEVASLDDAMASLRQAGVGFRIETSGGRRTVEVDPAAAHGVRLILVEGDARWS